MLLADICKRATDCYLVIITSLLHSRTITLSLHHYHYLTIALKNHYSVITSLSLPHYCTRMRRMISFFASRSEANVTHTCIWSPSCCRCCCVSHWQMREGGGYSESRRPGLPHTHSYNPHCTPRRSGDAHTDTPPTYNLESVVTEVHNWLEGIPTNAVELFLLEICN